MTDTNPPVGATVVVGRTYTKVEDEYGDQGWQHGEGLYAHWSSDPILDAAWRLQQERDRWMETARLYAQNADHHRSQRETAEAENAALRAELAPLRALAVEAKAAHDLPPDEKAEAEYSIRKRLAALATPNQEPTP